LLGMIGFLVDNEMLLQLNVPLEVVGLIILLVRLRSFLAPSQWGGSIVEAMPRVAVIGLIAGIGLLAYVVSLFVGGAEFEEIAPYLLALDHTNFILVVTNLIFAMMAIGSDVSERANRIIFWGTNIGAVGFVVGLMTESSTLKRIFTPVLGLALLYGIFTYLTAKEAQPVEATV
jgi:predicted membrane protein